MDLSYLIDIAKNAAIEAGSLLINKKKDMIKVNPSDKRDTKLVGDIESEKLIKNKLLAHSDYQILAEESGKSHSNLGDIFWVVDPLDGTANYERDFPISCVSIALVKNLEPILGVIYNFNNEDIYYGSIQHKAMKNHDLIEVSKISNKNQGFLLTGLPIKTDYSEKALIEYIKDFQRWKKVRMIGSAAMASCYVASGIVDAYKEKNTNLWDVAAGYAIINASGGTAVIGNLKRDFSLDIYTSNGVID